MTAFRFEEWLESSFSFLFSLVFHLVLLLSLAMLVIEPSTRVSIDIYIGNESEEVVLDTIHVDLPEQAEMSVVDLANAVETMEQALEHAVPEIPEIELAEIDRIPPAPDRPDADSIPDLSLQIPVGSFVADASNATPAQAPADLGQRLQREQAQGGHVQISLAWNNVNDLDLHVVCPSGEVINYRNTQSRCGGRLDVDMNVHGNKPWSQRPVENVFWPYGGCPPGEYVVIVDHFGNNGGRDPTRYWVTVSIAGQPDQTFTGTIRTGQPSQIVCSFHLDDLL